MGPSLRPIPGAAEITAATMSRSSTIDLGPLPGSRIVTDGVRMTRHLPLAALTLTIALSATPHVADAARPVPAVALVAASSTPRETDRVPSAGSVPMAGAGSVHRHPWPRRARSQRAGRHGPHRAPWRRPSRPDSRSWLPSLRRSAGGCPGTGGSTWAPASVRLSVRRGRARRVRGAHRRAGCGVHRPRRAAYHLRAGATPRCAPATCVRSGDRIGSLSTGTGHCGSRAVPAPGTAARSQYLDPLLLLGRTSARLRPW